jgi:phospholipase D1/2
MVSGPVAASLGELARERWRALGEDNVPPIGRSVDDLWPSDVEPDLEDVDVAISRTVPEFDSQAAIRECEALFLDTIAAARQSIYIESQYVTSERLGAALATRLREADGPEVLIVAPRECEGWLERQTMGAFRERVFRQLTAADLHNRLRLVYPSASRAHDIVTFVHSKVTIVDDRLVRIGSANVSRRSMGMDTECDLTVDVGSDPSLQAGIRRIRNRLLGEHLGLTEDEVGRAVEREGSLRAVVDSRADADRTLIRIEVAADAETSTPAALQAVADPEEPEQFAAWSSDQDNRSEFG